MASDVVYSGGKLTTEEGTVLDIEALDATLASLSGDQTLAGAKTFSGAVTLGADSTLSDGVDLAVGTGTGTKLATAAAQKLGLWGVTPVAQQATIADAAVAQAAITGGESPTEAEFNALRTDVVNLVSKFNTLLSELEATGILASS